MLKRSFDLIISLTMLTILMIPIMIISVIVRISSHGTAFYWSKRVGKNNQLFMMPKFRTMRVDTPEVATHLLENPEKWLTKIGFFLRGHSLDEIPQLFSIFKGDMSFVGPRPALFNQDDLIELRKQKKIDSLKPGLTGWAQINGRDHISIREKVELDEYYLQNHSFLLDIKIICMTFFKVLKKEGVVH